MAKTSRRPERASAAAQLSPKKASMARPGATPALASTDPVAVALPSQDAVGLFQKAMEALQRHRYGAAADTFKALLDGFPAERALLDRTRVYLDLCERELSRQPRKPATAEEKVTAATAALNDGRDEEAEQLAHSVLDEAPDHDLALYLLAAVHARRGEPDMALEWLGRALEVSPDVSAQARHDADFESLRDLEQFRHLLDARFSSQSGARRRSAARPDR
jgi:tetratricopeptide (TPR) repeat protein